MIKSTIKLTKTNLLNKNNIFFIQFNFYTKKEKKKKKKETFKKKKVKVNFRTEGRQGLKF
jgi:hypothetical protein